MARNTPLLKQLEEIVPTGMAKYILWKYDYAFKDKDQAYILKVYLNDMSPDKLSEYEAREDYNQAVKLINKLAHNNKMNQLYALLYEKASEGDIQSIKAFTDFSKLYFQNNEDEFSALMNGIDIGDDDE